MSTMTRGELAALLHNLRLSPGAKERLKDDVDLLWAIARPGDPERRLTLGPRTERALARVLAADGKGVRAPRGL